MERWLCKVYTLSCYNRVVIGQKVKGPWSSYLALLGQSRDNHGTKSGQGRDNPRLDLMKNDSFDSFYGILKVR